MSIMSELDIDVQNLRARHDAYAPIELETNLDCWADYAMSDDPEPRVAG